MSSLRPTERLTLVLTAVYLATLAVVYVLDDVVAWLVWAVVMVVVTGAVLVAYNRSSSVDPEADAGDERSR